MRLLHSLAKTHASFDDPNLVSHAGLVPVMALAERAGLPENLVAEHVRPGRERGVNAGLKVPCLVAGMAAGADSIDDMDVLRHGAMGALFGGVRAPSTLGSHLRSYTWGKRGAAGEGGPGVPGGTGPAGAAAARRGDSGVRRHRLDAETGLRPQETGREVRAHEDPGEIAAGPGPERAGRDHQHAPIRYPRAIWDDQLQAWISDAEVAETEYTAFASKKGQAVAARLIVRRVRDLNKKAADGQDELFPAWRYDAVLTDSPFKLVQAEGQHRDHAIVEQVFADVTSGPLAHMPSGVFSANAAWLAIAAMAHNLVRAAGALAGLPFAKARAATTRRDLIAVAARTARHGRGHLTLHLPEGWHREQEWLNLLGAACGPPAAAA